MSHESNDLDVDDKAEAMAQGVQAMNAAPALFEGYDHSVGAVTNTHASQDLSEPPVLLSASQLKQQWETNRRKSAASQRQQQLTASTTTTTASPAREQPVLMAHGQAIPIRDHSQAELKRSKVIAAMMRASQQMEKGPEGGFVGAHGHTLAGFNDGVAAAAARQQQVPQLTAQQLPRQPQQRQPQGATPVFATAREQELFAAGIAAGTGQGAQAGAVVGMVYAACVIGVLIGGYKFYSWWSTPVKAVAKAAVE